MGRMYSASFDNVVVSAIQDLFELIAPTDSIVVLHSIELGQSTDFGDAAAEGLRVTVERFTSTNGSGGTDATARPHNVGDAAFGGGDVAGTVGVNNTTQGVTRTVIQAMVWNIQAGWFYKPTPEERLVLSPSGKLAVAMIAAPTDPITMSGTIVFEEIGG